MEFIETRVFSKCVGVFFGDDEYRRLQAMLLVYPDAGDVIPGSGGLRKLRWASAGKGKRGGIRIIYYWYVREEQIFLLYAYRKSAVLDLTKEQIKFLRQLIGEQGS
ncbi:MAG TPA: type II toxin-antitoxin system RelE/ParE family toxin [Candidatus Bathyarchaeia archaeon]|nr:type II toxin-antitoxin system RelE/ParE family toxin [Candidatus Bathyarchaeia archaeon]